MKSIDIEHQILILPVLYIGLQSLAQSITVKTKMDGYIPVS